MTSSRAMAGLLHCLSFFDMRGLVPRPLRIVIQSTAFDGMTTTAMHENNLARLNAPRDRPH